MTAQTQNRTRPLVKQLEDQIKRLRSISKKREAALVSILQLAYFTPIQNAQDIAAECLYGKDKKK